MKFTYQFFNHEKTKIKAIAERNRNCQIKTITETATIQVFPFNKTCKDLPFYTDQTSPNHLMTLVCEHENPGATAIGNLPPFDARILATAIKYSNLSEEAKIKTKVITEIILMFIDRGADWHKTNDYFTLPQMFFIMQTLAHYKHITAAILNEDCNSIVFQAGAMNYKMSFSYCGFMISKLDFPFNIEEGFGTAQQKNDYFELFNYLNKYVSAWQQRNYQGEIFPHNKILGLEQAEIGEYKKNISIFMQAKRARGTSLEAFPDDMIRVIADINSPNLSVEQKDKIYYQK